MKKIINKIPLDGFAGLKQNLTKDALSGFLVFLLALPLSLGIAKASDFPPIFGLVTAIIGGVVVSFFSGTLLSIKGPAAGLIVIASGSVAIFGGGEIGWQLTLGAIVVAGLFQILFGVLKLGSLADFFPTSAIHGMLAAIGIIIMSKQIHTLLGVDPSILKGREPLELLAMIPNSIMHENLHVTEIGLACLLILILLSVIKHQKIKKIPAPLVVLAVAIPLGFVLHIKTEAQISNYALVKIGNIFDYFPNGLINAKFTGITSNIGAFIQYVILFALIGSIESLLTSKAVDGQDPYKRKSKFNKDIIAVGIGNTIAGLLGGLPMISEVARSSANISNGGQTRWANFFHGVFLLIAVFFGVAFIEMIPNAALAAMLIFVGFKLAHPKEFIHMWKLGIAQFIIFCGTLIVTLATDLLIGIAFGILLKTIFTFVYGVKAKHLLKSNVTILENENLTQIDIEGNLVFTNILSFKKKIAEINYEKGIIIDVKNSEYIDQTCMEAINDLLMEFKANHKRADLHGMENHKKLGHGNTAALILRKTKK